MSSLKPARIKVQYRVSSTLPVQLTSLKRNIFAFLAVGGISCKTQQVFHYFFPCLSLSFLRVSEVAPYLRGDGLRRQVVLEGNRLVLTCLAGGSWPLQYRWTLNNSNLTDWTPHYRLVVTQTAKFSATTKGPFAQIRDPLIPPCARVVQSRICEVPQSDFFF